jgi:hypothetical protein
MPAGLLGIHGEAAQQPQEYSHAYKFRRRYPTVVS